MTAYKLISEFYSEDQKRTASIIKELGSGKYRVSVKSESGSTFSALFENEDDAESYAETWVTHSDYYYDTERNK
jgi:hypothetical protein